VPRNYTARFRPMHSTHLCPDPLSDSATIRFTLHPNRKRQRRKPEPLPILSILSILSKVPPTATSASPRDIPAILSNHPHSPHIQLNLTVKSSFLPCSLTPRGGWPGRDPHSTLLVYAHVCPGLSESGRRACPGITPLDTHSLDSRKPPPLRPSRNCSDGPSSRSPPPSEPEE
jgi:hypothetical protein